MQIHLSRATAVCAAALTACLLWAPTAARAQSDVEKKLTVGIFNRVFLVQTFYHSDTWKAKIQELMNARTEAALASDTLKVDQIDKQLGTMQAFAQQQLAGNAPLTNIYDALKSDWPAIAREANVDVIVETAIYVVPGSVLVDVTPVMVKHLNKQH